MQTNDGYVHPIDIKNGLAYVQMRPYTQEEWDTLPHVVWTSDNEWNPTIFDHSASDDQHWFDAIQDVNEDSATRNFNLYGIYMGRVHVNSKPLLKTASIEHDFAPPTFHFVERVNFHRTSSFNDDDFSPDEYYMAAQ